MAQTVTVNYATSNGTATAGSDYLPASGVLTYTPSSTSQSFQVTLLDDTLDEGDSETVTLALSNPKNIPFGFPSTASLVIVDDEPTIWKSYLPLLMQK